MEQFIVFHCCAIFSCMNIPQFLQLLFCWWKLGSFWNFAIMNKAAMNIYLVTPCGMWDLSSLTRDRTWAPCSSLNHWTTREVCQNTVLMYKIFWGQKFKISLPPSFILCCASCDRLAIPGITCGHAGFWYTKPWPWQYAGTFQIDLVKSYQKL